MVVGDEVEQVFVGPAGRGTGLAAVLLAEAERQVAAGGHEEAWLAVVAGNARARRFYEKYGWVDEGDLPYEVVAGGETFVSPCRRYTKHVETSHAASRVYVDMVGDLFHAGHVALLREARRHGDRLVVGVLSDDTAAAYKRRPIRTLAERVAVIESCRHVDEVVPDAPFRGARTSSPSTRSQPWSMVTTCHRRRRSRSTDRPWRRGTSSASPARAASPPRTSSSECSKQPIRTTATTPDRSTCR